MSTATDTPTVVDLLDETSARLDALCCAGLHHDPAMFELWRAVANLNAAVRILADELPRPETEGQGAT